MADSVQAELERALFHGIPLDRLPGLDEYLGGIAQRNPDTGFIAVLGEKDQVLQAVGLEPDRLAGLIHAMRDVAEPASRAVAARPVEREGYLVVRMRLRDAGETVSHTLGHVLVGVHPRAIRAQILRELTVVALGALAVTLLLAEMSAALVSAILLAPLRRLSAVMASAALGDFSTLVGRRPRDQLGRLLLACNAAVFLMHDRRQRFAAHADEVRSAVFDAEVARAVEAARDRTLDALGPGLATPPRRVVDARASDAQGYVALAVAAAALAAAAAVPAARGVPEDVPAFLAAGGVALLAGLLAGRSAPARRVRGAALLAGLAVACGAVLLLRGAALSGLVAALAGGGLAAGLSLAYVRRQVRGGAGTVLRATAVALVAALLWAVALDWNGGELAASALVLSLLALPVARPFVIPRS
ncbi:hypothetical protein DEW08_14135 [Azospirillum thermophilum]|uniref:HAMP domain-containing protein n=1 Tax=Azospirillum thermophilum TaxID=2202148 RepID=A0A2S2CUS5_9PROT|nr:hypothetical protein DEW08_14135 [Azospirillum thermophilum]